jgi:hypothetical protein
VTSERDDLTEQIDAALTDAGGLDQDELAFMPAAAYWTFAGIQKWERLEPGSEDGGEAEAGPLW